MPWYNAVIASIGTFTLNNFECIDWHWLDLGFQGMITKSQTTLTFIQNSDFDGPPVRLESESVLFYIKTSD